MKYLLFAALLFLGYSHTTPPPQDAGEARYHEASCPTDRPESCLEVANTYCGSENSDAPWYGASTNGSKGSMHLIGVSVRQWGRVIRFVCD